MRRRNAVPTTEISGADTEMTADLTVTNAAAHILREETAVTVKDVPMIMSVSEIRLSVMSAKSALSVMMNAMTTAVLSSAETLLSRL